MKKNQGNIEFIDHKAEQREISKTSLREILDGSVLAREKVVKQLPFVLFITFLMFLYIGNRYHTERIIRQTLTLQAELRDLRAESISLTSDLEYLSRQSQVARLVRQRGLGLVESQVPPVKIEVKNRKSKDN